MSSRGPAVYGVLVPQGTSHDAQYVLSHALQRSDMWRMSSLRCLELDAAD